MAIAVIGGNEFVVGFRLAGIKDVYEAGNNMIDRINEVRNSREITIAIVDEALLEKLDKHDRMLIESSISPVFVPLSTSSSQENLRFLIKKSIGIDILAK